jgi:hypothetical protein
MSYLDTFRTPNSCTLLSMRHQALYTDMDVWVESLQSMTSMASSSSTVGESLVHVAFNSKATHFVAAMTSLFPAIRCWSLAEYELHGVLVPMPLFLALVFSRISHDFLLHVASRARHFRRKKQLMHTFLECFAVPKISSVLQLVEARV